MDLTIIALVSTFPVMPRAAGGPHGLVEDDTVPEHLVVTQAHLFKQTQG